MLNIKIFLITYLVMYGNNILFSENRYVSINIVYL